jgi:hypothetical protein
MRCRRHAASDTFAPGDWSASRCVWKVQFGRTRLNLRALGGAGPGIQLRTRDRLGGFSRVRSRGHLHSVGSASSAPSWNIGLAAHGGRANSASECHGSGSEHVFRGRSRARGYPSAPAPRSRCAAPGRGGIRSSGPPNECAASDMRPAMLSRPVTWPPVAAPGWCSLAARA